MKRFADKGQLFIQCRVVTFAKKDHGIYPILLLELSEVQYNISTNCLYNYIFRRF